MNIRLILIFCLISIGSMYPSLADRPNIIFIMSDDHTWQAVGAYDSRFKYLDPTPNLDKLAKSGMVFDHAICGNAICTPSRASIMTCLLYTSPSPRD